jgi:hypothetical protein
VGKRSGGRCSGLHRRFIEAHAEEKFPPPHGTDNPIVSGSLKLCGVTIMVALLLTLYGLLRSNTSCSDSNA